MIDVSRRETIKLLGGAVASVAVPGTGLASAPAPELQALKARVEELIADIDPNSVFDTAQYRQLFTTVPSHPAAPTGDAALGYTINLGAPEVEIRPASLGLIKAIKEYREINANNLVPTVLAGQMPNLGGAELNLTNLRRACDLAVSLGVQPLQLIVPVTLMIEAELIMRDAPEHMPGGQYMTWDYLHDDRQWFVRTDASGLDMVEDEQIKIARSMMSASPRANGVLS